MTKLIDLIFMVSNYRSGKIMKMLILATVVNSPTLHFLAEREDVIQLRYQWFKIRDGGDTYRSNGCPY